MTPITLRARWILPICSPPIADGYVAIGAGRIVAVGKREVAQGTVEDLGDVALLPALVNAHCHLEFSGLAAPLGAPGTPLPAWIEQVIGERKRGRRDPTAEIAAGLVESLQAGVTTIGDIATASPAAYFSSPLPARPRLIRFHEAIGFSRARSESVFADVTARAAATAGHLEANADGVSPHAPYSVHPDLVERLCVWAAERNVPVAMHLAESPEELELLQNGTGPFRELLEARSMWDPAAIPPGTRPLAYLRRLAVAPRALIVHGNYLDVEEIAYLAAHRDRLSVVYCPRTHEYFGHEPHPLPALRAAGVRVALGTDSRASNPDLDLMGEVRAVLKAHPQLTPTEALEMATREAAAALGASGDVGALSPGLRADLLAIPVSADDDPTPAVIAAPDPRNVWLAGALVAGPGAR
ncbi:MAG: amidohydrolase family protein [Pirellulales bacterium]|nr:amidohydrolase family protein [Pirellulales bacterium]